MFIRETSRREDDAVWRLGFDEIQSLNIEQAKNYSEWCERLEADYKREIAELRTSEGAVHRRLELVRNRIAELETE